MVVIIRKAYVDTSIGQIHYRYAGDGDPLVLLHQTATSSEVYEPLMGLLASSLFVVAVDTPGFGMSAFSPHAYNISDYVRILKEVLDGLSITTTSVFGHHTGASIACELAAGAPKRVKKLILSCPICYSAEELKRRLNARRAPPLVLKEDGSYLKEAWDDVVGRQMGQDLDLETKHRETVWRLRAGPRYHEAQIAVYEYDMPSRLPLVESPTLIIAGEHDPHRNVAEPAARLIRQARHHIVPGSGHWPEYEQRQELARLILDFLAGS